MERVDELALETFGSSTSGYLREGVHRNNWQIENLEGGDWQQVINRLNKICRISYGGDVIYALEQPAAGMDNIWIIGSFNLLVLLPTMKQIILNK